jgi:hypothetical protein
MESKRIGKDLRLIWRDIKTNGEFVSLNGRDLTLIMTDPKGGKTEMQMAVVDDYNVESHFYGKDHKYLGVYMLTLWENYGKIGQTALDKPKAFRLVPTTDLETEDDE